MGGIFMSLKMSWTMWTSKWEPNTFALPTPCGSVVWVRKGIHVFPWSREGTQNEFAVEFSGVNKTACICNSTSAWQDTLHSCVYRYSPALRQDYLPKSHSQQFSLLIRRPTRPWEQDPGSAFMLHFAHNILSSASRGKLWDTVWTLNCSYPKYASL